MLAPLRGYNFDVESYRIVADIVSAGGNVYAETDRYNYGPIWFHILHALDVMPWFDQEGVVGLRWKVASFLTLVDLGILWLLVEQYSIKVGALFFLNPLSILITGYHSQFDNLAVLTGLLSVVLYDRRRSEHSKWLCLAGIGISLCVKHILFLFPCWLAVKEERLSRKVMVLFVPYAIFLGAFLWYLPEGGGGIVKNVFMYRSLDNAPLWSLLAPNTLYTLVPWIVPFVAVLFVLGLYWRKKNSLESLNLYLVSLVVFSSAVANQYLSICASSIATMWNWAYALYSVLGTVFLVVHNAGLHVDVLGLNVTNGYQWLILTLAIGLMISSAGQLQLNRLLGELRSFATWLGMQIRLQIKAPW